MKYYLVVGETSGDLHASHLMSSIRELDSSAQFRFVGGDLMQAVGGIMVRHYKDTAFMGFVPVMRHLPQILCAMREVQSDVVSWAPDALILVDYPGFNLRLARFIKKHTDIPVFYYIAPKIWAWKEGRIKVIKKYIDHMLSILPFETDFFEGKHHYPIHYVGNPTMDEVTRYKSDNPRNYDAFCSRYDLDVSKPLLAILPGSRNQEIKSNLSIMLDAVTDYAEDYNIVIAVADNVSNLVNEKITGLSFRPHAITGAAFDILNHATAALVVSGTATLETALFNVPQIVCYKISPLMEFLRKHFLKIPYVSLVNLVAGRDYEIVPELLVEMNKQTLGRLLPGILPGGEARSCQLDDYRLMADKIGTPGTPRRAAMFITDKVCRKGC